MCTFDGTHAHVHTKAISKNQLHTGLWSAHTIWPEIFMGNKFDEVTLK